MTTGANKTTRAAWASVRELLNRPMVRDDLRHLQRSDAAASVLELVSRYGGEQLPVLNGSLRNSNLVEGKEHVLTCLPYRLWEYSSILDFVSDQCGTTGAFLDVGGAGSPLSFILAEKGWSGVAVDLQPLLIALCNFVSQRQGLPLEAVLCDITAPRDEWIGRFDLVTLVSVLEHVPVSSREGLIRAIARLLKPGGVAYLTFDYGHFTHENKYFYGKSVRAERTASIEDIHPIAEAVERAGLSFIGNDPRVLPSGILACTEAPGYRQYMSRRDLNIGPVDGLTPWGTLCTYACRRILCRFVSYRKPCRFQDYSFFRMFVRRCS